MAEEQAGKGHKDMVMSKLWIRQPLPEFPDFTDEVRGVRLEGGPLDSLPSAGERRCRQPRGYFWENESRTLTGSGHSHASILDYYFRQQN